MAEVVAAEEFSTGEFIRDIEADGQVGERGKARNGIGNTRLDHERDKAEGSPRDFEKACMERLRHAVEECGECGKDHRECNQFNAFDFEVEKGKAHYGGIRNRVQHFRNEQAFPEFSADEIPVEKRMLENKPECENQFAVKNRVTITEREREGSHEERCCRCRK